MNKFFDRKSFITGLCLLAALLPAALARGEYKEDYYSEMDGKSKATLKAAAKTCVEKHTKLNYSNLPNQWQYSDVYPELVDGCKRWWEMYSNEVYLIKAGQDARSSFSANKMQREHSVPKSWWKHNGDVEYTPAYTDLWNLYPSDGPANQAKLNYPLGPVSSASFDNGCSKVGGTVAGYGGGAAKVFEPADEYKGDFARSFFYMATVYDDLPWVINYMFVNEEWPTLQSWASKMLLQWARQDPVSQKEITRNDEVEKYQGNRNPFVDFPELGEYIWGTRTAEVFYIKDQGGSQTPPITGDPELTAPVTGEALDFGQAALNASVTSYLEIKGNNFIEPISVRVNGADKDCFTLPESQIYPSALNGVASYMFPIVFTPSSNGKKEATLILYDGGLAGSVSVTLRGEGVDRPVLSTLTALDPSDVTATSYTANWTASPQVVDFYVVTRVIYGESGTVSKTYETPGTSYTFTDYNPSVTESYTVQSSRLGILSEPSNSVVVASAGVNTLEGEGTLLIGNVQGGFGVIDNPMGASLEVYDMSGRLVKTVESPAAGDLISLPNGVFVVISPYMSHPVKIIVY